MSAWKTWGSTNQEVSGLYQCLFLGHAFVVQFLRALSGCNVGIQLFKMSPLG